MELFGVGIGEAGLVLLIALLVVGPERFPHVAREGGRWYRMARKFAADVTADLQGALTELENEVKEQTGDLRSVREIGDDVEAGMRETRADVTAIGQGVGAATAGAVAATTLDAPSSDAGDAEPPGLGGVQDATPAPNPTDPMDLVRRSYAAYHQPAAVEPAAVDPDEMSRHATEAFETFRSAETPAPAPVTSSLLTAVNPFPSSTPTGQVEATEEPPEPAPVDVDAPAPRPATTAAPAADA